MTDQGRIDELNRENARLAAAIVFILHKEDAGYVSFLGCPYRKKLEEVLDGSSTALDDLLEPVVELLTMLEQREHSRDGASHMWKLIDTQLTRLRAVMGKEKT